MADRFSDELAVVAAIDPTTAGTGTSTSDTIDLELWGEVTFILSVGTVASTGTVDMTVNSGTATGTITTSVTDITQFTLTDDNVQAIVTVDDSKVSGRYLNATVKRGAANSNVSLIALARKARYKPASDNDLASVDEIVNKT